MPVKYLSDKNGPFKGIPYDGLQTIADGNGKWWEGMDPVDLYGPVHTSKDDPLHSPFANQFMWRVDDAISKYHPDVIYFDDHAGDSQVDMGVHMGLGFLAPQLIANYYNKSLKRNHGKMEVVVNLKGVGGRYNSFQNSNDLLPFVEHSLVKSSEKIIEKEISAYPFQTEESISEWHYQTGQKKLDAPAIVKILMENVSRNGTLLLNLTQHGRGDLDGEVIQTAKDIGAWLKINSEAIYGSRPFEVYGDTAVYYTRNKNKLYATLIKWNGGSINLKALASNGATLGKVTKVELLAAGNAVSLPFTQNEQGLSVMPPTLVKVLSGINNSTLASQYRVLRISHDKNWTNDDDPGVRMAQGWFRQANLNTGEFNNDLTISNTPGAKWQFSFTGKSISLVAPKQTRGGKIEVLIDGKLNKTVDLSSNSKKESQQIVYRNNMLTNGNHTISIINLGGGPVAIDALIIANKH
jgi:alpha-L-fucosidase